MRKRYYVAATLILIVATVLLVGCAKKTMTPESVLDNPQVHYNRGMLLLDRNDLQAAREQFERAKALDPKYPPAYAGLALVDAMGGDFKSAEENFNKSTGLDYECVQCWIAKGRVITMRKQGEHWMDEAKDAFEKATKLAPNSSEAYYYLGAAYMEAHMFRDAEDAFAKVVGFKDDFSSRAAEKWDLMQKVVQAAPITEKGKEIALIPAINRADLAVLFMEELKLPELLEKKRPKEYDTGFKAPEDISEYKQEETGKTEAPLATDIQGNWAASWIKEIIALGGMETFPDHTFRPNEPVTRADFAVLLQNLIVLITNDASLLTKYLGEAPHFPDMRSDNWAYNAAVLCVDRGILKTKMDGSFAPMETVSGADALLAIRDFQNALRQTF
jgi:tetratricopeptide (TPR) repeat protein